MHHQDQSDTDLELLGKYLSGEATPEEAIAVDRWLYEPANKKVFDKIERIWNGLPGDNRHQLPDRTAAWRALQPHLRIRKESPVLRLVLNRYFVAASILMLAGGIALFFILQKHTTGVRQEMVAHGPSQKIIRDSLPDGSQIVLKRNSVLWYSKTFNTGSREVQLQGQSFFKVTPDKLKPFIVQVGDVHIKVLGTAFNVKQNSDPATIEVQVQYGLVKMYTNRKEVAVGEGQTGVYDKARDAFYIKDSIDAIGLSYATREFSFSTLTMQQVIPYLEDAYGVTIVARKKEILQYVLSARFVEVDIERVLEMLNLSLGITYTKEGNTYYLDGK